jgi:hypothetical protein
MRKLVRGTLYLGAIGLFAFGLFIISKYPPTEDSFYPKCTLHSQTGLHCPGCGLTRSVFSLLHGEVMQALAYNLLWPIILPIFLWGIGTSLWNSLSPDRPIHLRVPQVLLAIWPWLLVGTMFAFGILRNIPVYPFTLLAPHELTP